MQTFVDSSAASGNVRSRYVVYALIGLPILAYASYVAYLVLPYVVEAVVPAVTRAVIGS